MTETEDREELNVDVGRRSRDPKLLIISFEHKLFVLPHIVHQKRRRTTTPFVGSRDQPSFAVVDVVADWPCRKDSCVGCRSLR